MTRATPRTKSVVQVLPEVSAPAIVPAPAVESAPADFVPAELSSLTIGQRLMTNYGWKVDDLGRPDIGDAVTATALTEAALDAIARRDTWARYEAKCAAIAEGKSKSLTLPKRPARARYAPAMESALIDAALSSTGARVSHSLRMAWGGIDIGKRSPAEYARAALGKCLDGSNWLRADGSAFKNRPSQASLIRESLR